MITLPCVRASAKRARDHVGEITEGWPVDNDDVRLIVSELATNAIRYAKSETFRADAYSRVGPVGLYLVEVWDADDTLPTPGCSGSRDGGRGLLMVASIACGWGARHVETGGKVVYAGWVIP
ncbi:hypothetical protein GCM10022254_40460 [Actinomadura meridiana]|uniref:Histidine kinase/HSP90-like ATPase domain-containing protein n=1 Tax=Actinomadura meridiana TaxID=559626 RepID=A0ABP8C6W3_9ACTN